MRKEIFLATCFAFSLLLVSAQESWEVLNPKPSSLTGLDIHFLSESNGFYITSNGLYGTSDSGETWELKEQLSYATDLAFNDNLGIIVGSNGSVLISEDYGSSWYSKNIGASEALNTISILDSENIIISGNNSVFVSADGGDSWTQKDIPDYRVKQTFFLSPSTGHAVTTNGQIFKTVDGGDNWYETANYTNFFPNSFFTIFFKDENVGFATREHDEFYKTIDGGETWQAINTGNYNAIFKFQFIDENIGFGAGEYGVYKTLNGGDTWSRIGVDKDGFYSNSNMYGIYFFDADRGISVGQRGRIAKTIDSGENWELYSPIEGTIKQLEFVSSDLAVTLVNNDFYKSSNNGTSWEYLGTPAHYNYSNGFDFVNSNVGFSVGGGSTSAAGSVYKTTDGGATWTNTNNGQVVLSEGVYCIDFINEQTGFVSGGFNRRSTLKTIDGGDTWTEVLSESLGKIQFLDENVGYGRRVGNSYFKIFKTIDGGDTWTEVFVIQMGINDFDFLDSQNGYLVGDQGLIYRTDDGGTTWQKLNLPYGFYEKVKFYNKNVGYVVEDSGHIYKTVNGGLTWNLIYTLYGLEDLNFNSQQEVFITGTFGKIFKSQVTFKEAEIAVGEPEDITAISADIKSIFASNAGTISNLKIEYGENDNFENSIPIDGSVVGGNSQVFLTTLDSLLPNTTYSYRAVGTANGNDYYSEVKSFSTLENYSMLLYYASNIGNDTADLYAQVASNNQPLTDIGFEYGTSSESFEDFIAASPSIVTISAGSVGVQAGLQDLNSNTEYFFRARAMYEGETIYSNILDFTTRPDYSIYNYYPSISNTNVTFNAVVTPYKDDFTEIVFEYGPQSFEFSLDANPSIVEQNRPQNIDTETIVLDENEIYYYRVKAKMAGTEVYGPESIFSLSENTLLVTNEVTEIQAESVVLHARVFSNASYLSNIQFEYGINGVFDQTAVAQPNFSSSNSTTQVQTSLTGLLPQTEYNFRLKGTDSNGTDFYSEVGSFTTFFSSESFVTTWQTDIPDESDDNQITIPTFSGETYNYSVDWGDGTMDTNVTGNITHDYDTPGTYQVAITGDFPRIYFSGIGDNSKIIAIDQWGTNQWSSFEDAFNGCDNLDMKATDVPDLSNVTNLNRAFGGCRSLIANETLNNWDVSGINTMISIFGGARTFDQFIGDWDVSNVENLSAAFFLASSYNQDLSNWDVSRVKEMGQLFQEADAFNQDISSWDVSNVERMDLMFKGADSFNQDIATWNIEKVESIAEIFQDAGVFNQDLSAWIVSNISLARNAFDNSGLSDENYGKMLVGWSQLPSLQNGVELGASQNQYCEAEGARQFIIDTYGWTIVDAGRTASCPVDSDIDGVTDEFDLCPNTPAGTAVNENGCDVIPNNAIQVYVLTPSCSNTSDGVIEIFMNTPGYLLDIAINGSDMSNQFDDVVSGANFVIDNLSAGVYSLTISVPEILFEQDYVITVNELQSITGKRQSIDVSSQSVSYSVSGSKNYVVLINGEKKLFQFENTTEQTLVIDNLSDQNEVAIVGQSDCQGKIEDTFFIGESISVFPTITSDYIYISGNEIKDISIFGLDGKLLSEVQHMDGSVQKEVDFSSFPSGLYLVKILSAKEERTAKIIKL